MTHKKPTTLTKRELKLVNKRTRFWLAQIKKRTTKKVTAKERSEMYRMYREFAVEDKEDRVRWRTLGGKPARDRKEAKRLGEKLGIALDYARLDHIYGKPIKTRKTKRKKSLRL